MAETRDEGRLGQCGHWYGNRKRAVRCMLPAGHTSMHACYQGALEWRDGGPDDNTGNPSWPAHDRRGCERRKTDRRRADPSGDVGEEDPVIAAAWAWLKARQDDPQTVGVGINKSGAAVIHALLARLRRSPETPVAWMVEYLEVDGTWQRETEPFYDEEDARTYAETYTDYRGDPGARIVPLVATQDPNAGGEDG